MMLLLYYTVIHNSLSPLNGHTVQSTQKQPNRQVQRDWLALHNVENKGALETKDNSVVKLEKCIKLVTSNL